MKDYLLSEIKNHDRNKDWEVCDDELLSPLEIARLRDIHDDILYTNIEPRDMIELPCKEKNTWGDVVTYDVIYRDKYGHIQVAHDFFEEIGADKFLQELKNGEV